MCMGTSKCASAEPLCQLVFEYVVSVLFMCMSVSLYRRVKSKREGKKKLKKRNVEHREREREREKERKSASATTCKGAAAL